MGTIINDNGIDQEKWDEVQPLLKKSWDECVAEEKTAKEFAKMAFEILGLGGKLYFEKFLNEILRDKETKAKKEVVAKNSAETAAGTETQNMVYPRIDRSKFIPNRSQDVSYGEGNFRDGRPFRVEMWFDQGYTYLTYFLPRVGVEAADPETLKGMLVAEGIIDFHDDKFHRSSHSGINLDVKEGSDDAGNEMWIMTVIVGDEDSEETFISDHVEMKRFEFKYKRDGKPEAYVVALMNEGGNYQPYFVNNSDKPIEFMRVGVSKEYKNIAPRSYLKIGRFYFDWDFDWVNEINLYLKTKDEEFYLCYRMPKYFIGDFLSEKGKLDDIPVMNKLGLIVK